GPAMSSGPCNARYEDKIFRSGRADCSNGSIGGLEPFLALDAMRLVHQTEQHSIVVAVARGKSLPEVGKGGGALPRGDGFTPVAPVIVRIENNISALGCRVSRELVEAFQLGGIQLCHRRMLQSLPAKRDPKCIH